MTITGQNFELFQGDKKILVVTIYDDDGSILPLTGYTAIWCAHNQGIANIVIQKTTEAGGITIPNPANGQLHIDIDSIDTAMLPPKIYGHQCEIEDISGNHATIFTGYMKVLKSITHLVV